MNAPSIEREKPEQKEQKKVEDVGEKEETPLFGVTEKPKYHDLDYDAMIRKAIEIPALIVALEAKIQALINKQSLLDISIKSIEETTYLQVVGEMDGDKKKYTNDKARDTESNSRLKTNQEYMELKEEKRKALEMTNKTKSEIDENKGMMRSMELVVELMKLKLRVI